MEPIPEMTMLEERLMQLELAIQRMDAKLDRIETGLDICVNYAQTQAQLQGLVTKAREDYERLEKLWKRIVEDRKKNE